VRAFEDVPPPAVADEAQASLEAIRYQAQIDELVKSHTPAGTKQEGWPDWTWLALVAGLLVTFVAPAAPRAARWLWDRRPSFRARSQSNAPLDGLTDRSDVLSSTSAPASDGNVRRLTAPPRKKAMP
jgi:hypothetical protein